jgi:ATP synthase protein I
VTLREARVEQGPDKNEKGPGLGQEARALQAAVPYIGAVWKLVGGAVFGVVAGGWLDKKLGTTPWLMVALSAVGISVGFYGFIRDVTRLGKRKP